jgi:hypothetical protein
VAGKQQVTLTFAGDSKSLERTFDKVGAGSKTMATNVDTDFKKVGKGARDLRKASLGVGNTLSGVQDTSQGVAAIMRGDLLGGAILLQSGFQDLAAGVAKFAVTIAKTVATFVANTATMVASHVAAVATTVAGWVTMGVQSLIAGSKMALAWLIGLGPIALVILGIGAVIGILALLGVSFDDMGNAAKSVWSWIARNWPLLLAILTGPIGLAVLAIWRHKDSIINAFRSAFNWVKGAATGTKDWIVARFNDVVSFFSGIPGRIANIFSGVGSAIVNGIKSVWNGSIGGFGFDVPSWVPGVGGRSFRIPRLHQGGVMPGAPGTEGLALLQAGERVTRAGAGAAPVSVVINVQGSIRSDRDLVKLIRDELTAGGFA